MPNNKNNNNKKNSKSIPKASRPISVYKKIAISFIVLTLILVGAVVYFSVVSVKIIIIPNKERLATSFIVQVQEEIAEPTEEAMSIKGIVESLPLEANDTFPATAKDVEETKVVGTVTIYNNYTKNQPLIKTTRLLSPDGKLFRISETINVPAGGKVEDVPMYADESSKEMEIEPTKFTIPGLWEGLQEQIYAESSEPTQYQEIGDVYVSADDLEQAKTALRTKLSGQLESIVTVKKYKGYDKIIANYDDDKVVFNTEAEAGTKAEQFSMFTQAEGAIIAFNVNDISELAKKKLEERLPDDKELESFSQDNFIFSLDRYDLDSKSADIKIEVVGQMVLKEDTTIINPEKLTGLTREQLDDYLSGLREVAGYEIKFTPAWIKKVPTLVDRIKVEIAR